MAVPFFEIWFSERRKPNPSSCKATRHCSDRVVYRWCWCWCWSRLAGISPASSYMKRVREPFAQAGSPNSPPLRSAPGGKRVRPEVRQQLQQHADDRATRQEQQQQQGPFQALLAEHGVVWPSAGGMAGGPEGGRSSSLGFSCRRNPSKLRVGVERALVHDRARRGEFVEVMIMITTAVRVRTAVV